MAVWEDNFMGKVRREDWLAIGSQTPTRPNDPIDALVGDDRSDNLVAKWEQIAAEYQIPVMAEFHAFDSEAKTTFRVPIDTQSIEKGLIKVKINQSERLRALDRSGVQGDQALYNSVMDDGIRLADQVITRTKIAKNEMLATGKVTIKENNLDLTVDYHVPANHLNLELDFSDDADTDIPSQIEAIVEQASDEGITLNGIITSRKNVTKLRKNAEIQKLINGSASEGALVGRSALEAFLEEEYGIGKIITTDLTYGVADGIDKNGRPKVKQKRYFPDNKASFISANAGGKLGIGLWGNPPEVDLNDLLKVQRSGRSPYVYITQWAENDPAVLWTKASGLFMPVLYNPWSLFVATVKS